MLGEALPVGHGIQRRGGDVLRGRVLGQRQPIRRVVTRSTQQPIQFGNMPLGHLQDTRPRPSVTSPGHFSVHVSQPMSAQLVQGDREDESDRGRDTGGVAVFLERLREDLGGQGGGNRTSGNAADQPERGWGHVGEEKVAC